MIKYLLLVALVVLRIYFHSGNKNNNPVPFTSIKPNTTLNAEPASNQSTYSKINIQKSLKTIAGETSIN